MSLLEDDLERLYENLEAMLPAAAGNPCGTCRECCTAAGLSTHVVSELELQLIADRVGPEKVDDFRRYAAREKDAAVVCPYYAIEGARCTIYRHRPFSCRVFGHFRAEGTEMPPPCVFRGTEKVFPRQQYFATVPLARELRELMRRHQLHGSGAVRYAEGMTALPPTAAQLSFLDPEDPLDRAISHQVEGNFDQALEALQEARQELGDTPQVLQALGVVLEMLGRHVEAHVVFLRALEQVPDSAMLHYHVGYNQLAAGDRTGAFPRLARAAELNPLHGLAIGFMGYIKLIEGETSAGADLLERAVAIDPQNGYFHLRLGLAWLSCGRHEDGVRELRHAATLDMSREKALELLRSVEA